MKPDPVILLYAVLTLAALFFGDIANDLLSVGVAQPLINIVERLITLGIGVTGIYQRWQSGSLPPPEG